MAKNLKQHTSPRRVSRIFCGGLGLALFGVLGAAPALWGQGDELGEDFISDIFMEASEGMSLEPDSVPPPQGSAPEEAVPPPPLPPVPVEESVPAEPLPLPTGAESAPVVAEPPAAVETPPVAFEQPPEAEPLPELAPTPAVTEERLLPQIPPEPAATPPPTAVKKTAGKPPLREQPQAAAQIKSPADEAVQTAPVQAAPAQTAQAEPKKAGKPPRYDALGEMPTATLEPAAQEPPTEAAPPPADSATGERPLPVPPGEGTNVAETGDDYFLGPDDLAEGVETSANSIAMPINLGALPSLEWETTDPSAPTATFISNSPLPQFDSSESGWKQLEVGQAETVTPPPPPERPASVSTVTQGEAVPPSAATPPTLAAAPNTDREQLRSLFSDMLPPPAQGARPPAGASPPPQPAQAAKSGGKGIPARPAEPKTEPAAAPQPETLAGSTDPAPPEEEDMGGSAILRAGGQLTVEGHFGEAAILPPLENAPDLAAWIAAQQKTEGQTAAPPTEKGEQPGKAAPPQKTASAAQNSPRAPAKPAAPIVRSPLSLVNETGSDRMLEIYRSVLSQMGYQIVSVESRPPAAQPTGETIILYRPGLRARARAVAGHLPGRKSLVETAAALPTEISILLR